ncbi:MAG TPA: ester cyclase [Bauldia sp.]|nr:ester cyclase [Bauldia sp.]
MRPLRAIPVLAFTLGLGVLAAPASAQECPTPSESELEAIATAYFDAFNKGDRDALDALLAEDYVQNMGAIMSQDRALHLERLMAVRAGFPDGVYTIDWTITDGDKVVIRNTFRGTHRGEFAGVPASGNKVAVGAFHVHRVKCGKIAETWNAGDALGLFRQMGALDLNVTTDPDAEPMSPAAPSTSECVATGIEENKAASRRWYDEVLNQGRMEALDEIVWAEEVHHSALFPDTVGIDAIRGSLSALRATFPDIKFSVDDILADGNMVLVRWTGRGTHTGTPFLGVATSGKPVEWQGMNAFRFECGKIIEGWSEANGLALLRQLGGME